MNVNEMIFLCCPFECMLSAEQGRVLSAEQRSCGTFFRSFVSFSVIFTDTFVVFSRNLC
jgi:hypothetical protein